MTFLLIVAVLTALLYLFKDSKYQWIFVAFPVAAILLVSVGLVHWFFWAEWYSGHEYRDIMAYWEDYKVVILLIVLPMTHLTTEALTSKA